MLLKVPTIKLLDQEHRMGFLVCSASYRIAIPVTKIVKYPTYGYCYPLCPRCGQSMEREYVSFCDRCGQKLSWDKIESAKILTAPIIE